MSEENHFKIIVPMYNCENLSKNCIDSILRQKYNNWQAVICIDPSTDKTAQVVKDYLFSINDNRFILIINSERKYVPRNHVESINLSSPKDEDIIVFLDGDDEFFGDDVLSFLNNEYLNSDIWITWGNYVYSTNLKKAGGGALPYPSNCTNIRKALWGFSHLKTFKYFLWKNIDDEELRDKKTHLYYTVTGDMAVMYPLVEMAGPHHSKFIEKILYIYNYTTPFNDDKINRVIGQKNRIEIQNRIPNKIKTKNELLNKE